MKKILITGGSGLLGSNIAKLAASKFKVYATYNKNPVSMKDVSFFQIDLTKEEQCAKMKKIRPDFIIHCAALSNIDYCEDYPKETFDQNVLAGINIAEIARSIGAYLIHISTDNVFDGTKGNYKENDIPNPINVYGKTKLEAEKNILSIHDKSCIVRTNIYGWNKIDKFSLAEWMLNKLTNNLKLPAFEDIFFSPILVNDLIEVLFKLQGKKYEGILHIAGSEKCSKLNFAYKIAEIFELDKIIIKPTSIHESELKAPRGRDTSLNVSKAEKVLKIQLPKVEEGIVKMKKLREAGYVEELKACTKKSDNYYPCPKRRANYFKSRWKS